jgi:hypothetical protein
MGVEHVVGRSEFDCKNRKRIYKVPGGLQFSPRAMQHVMRVMKQLSQVHNKVQVQMPPIPGRVVG